MICRIGFVTPSVSTRGNISFWTALDAGYWRVPRPAAVMTALRTLGGPLMSGTYRDVSGSHEPTADRVTHESGRLVNLELSHELGAVRLGRLHAQAEHHGDFLRRLALGDELEHLAFARRQRIGRHRGTRQVRFDERARDARAQVDAVLQRLANRPDEVGSRLRLDHVAAQSGAKCLEDVLVL